MNKRVFLFHEGRREEKALLGNKGANLCEMTALGLPVPPGFVITTQACNAFFDAGKKLPAGLMEEAMAALPDVEAKMGQRFGDVDNPLLLSVRSGAAVSMPGMMDTVLNLGMNDGIAAGLEKRTGNPRFVWDSYRRFLQMFASVVLGADHDAFEDALTTHKQAKGYESDLDMTALDWKALVKVYKTLAKVPTDPLEQLQRAIEAVFSSWFGARARRYRQFNNIPENLGTAVNVQAMVFGNMGEQSGTGVAFTRNPATGEKRFYGEYLFNAEGEDVVSGIRTPLHLEELERQTPTLYGQLFQIQETLEQHYRDMQDLEFTIQEGRLFILQTRTGKRTAKAAVKIAVDMVKEGLISIPEALLRIDADKMDFFMHPTVDPQAEKTVIARGLPASPGAATGEVVFSADEAETLAAQGRQVIMVRRETTPEDIHGMRAAQGILTQFGGMTSHAAVVARGMGTCCVAGCGDIDIEGSAGQFTTRDGTVVKQGARISLDGTTGEVMLGEVATIPAAADADFQTVLEWADRYRRLEVRANADTPEDARKARDLGATGIGLCRTEHMFFAEERIDLVRSMILASSDEERATALDQLYRFQQEDMVGLFREMAGLPVTIRLLDPPLHEFLPRHEAETEALAKRLGRNVEDLRGRIAALTESNPMMGLRGCRLSIVHPDITRMQTRAVLGAAAQVQGEGLEVKPEIMVPLIATGREYLAVTEAIERAAQEVREETGVDVPLVLGTMMETPRACLRADSIAPLVHFMSFGTNDLTQLSFGFSRDDAGTFLGHYLESRLFTYDPFITLDQRGVGELVKLAIAKSKAAGHMVEFGICGEHGGDPRSIGFFDEAGLDYVSCSPFRVPIARLAAAQAAVKRLGE